MGDVADCYSRGAARSPFRTPNRPPAVHSTERPSARPESPAGRPSHRSPDRPTARLSRPSTQTPKLPTARAPDLPPAQPSARPPARAAVRPSAQTQCLGCPRVDVARRRLFRHMWDGRRKAQSFGRTRFCRAGVSHRRGLRSYVLGSPGGLLIRVIAKGPNILAEVRGRLHAGPIPQFRSSAPRRLVF